MKKTIPVLLLLIVGCTVESKHPLSNPKESKADKDLAGLWQFQFEEKVNEELAYLHIIPRNDGHYDFVYVEHKSDAKLPHVNLYQAFVTEIGKNKYMSVRAVGEKGVLAENYSLVNYKLSKNTLSIGLMKTNTSSANAAKLFRTSE